LLADGLAEPTQIKATWLLGAAVLAECWLVQFQLPLFLEQLTQSQSVLAELLLQVQLVRSVALAIIQQR
jgi:hypothetical protein